MKFVCITHRHYEQPNTIIHTSPATHQLTLSEYSSNTNEHWQSFYQSKKNKNKKCNSSRSAFTDCARLNRQIECVASESNYFLESHTVALFPFDLHLPVCQLRHLAHWHKMLSAPKKPLIIFTEEKKIIWCRDVIGTWKQRYSQVLKNISGYNIGQIALIKYTEEVLLTQKGTIGATFKRKQKS